MNMYIYILFISFIAVTLHVALNVIQRAQPKCTVFSFSTQKTSKLTASNLHQTVMSLRFKKRFVFNDKVSLVH